MFTRSALSICRQRPQIPAHCLASGHGSKSKMCFCWRLVIHTQAVQLAAKQLIPWQKMKSQRTDIRLLIQMQAENMVMLP
nr:MAG TPA: hypothetical protein [Caudoviricetes sp.]